LARRYAARANNFIELEIICSCMKVSELVEDAQECILEKQIMIARGMLECKLKQLKQARDVVNILEEDLKELEEMNVEDIDVCECGRYD